MLLRRFTLPALALAAALSFTACSKKSETGAASDGGKPLKVLRYGNGFEVQDLDPQTVTGIPEHHVVTALFEGLVSEDPVDLHPVPGVAKSWDISEDGLVYTFHLREDARWSSGEPVTAHDFVRSYKRILTPALGADYAYMLYNYVAGAKDYYEGRITDFSEVGFRAIDDRTLEVRLLHPTPYLLNAMNHYAWFPVHIPTVEKFGGLDRRGTAWTRLENLVGNGPFVLKEWRPNQRLVVKRSPTYWDRDTVQLDEIAFYPVDNLDAEERMFRTGELDITQEIPVGKIDAYRRDNPSVLRIDPYLGIYFYRFNTRRAPLDDVRVRKALALAVDRESLVKNVTRAGEQPAYAVSYPNNNGYTPQARLTGTIEDAKRLLAEAGYPDGKGAPVIELLYNSQQNHRLIAEALQQMWRKNLGIEVTLRNEEWRVYLDAVDTGNFMMQRAGWIADYTDPNVFLDLWETNNLNNDTGWGSPVYDELLARSLQAKTDEERFALYQQMDAILVEELPVMPLFYYTRPRLVSERVTGFHPTLLDNHPWKHVGLKD